MNPSSISYLSNDMLQICMLYLHTDDLNNADIEVFGNTCKAYRKLSIFFIADKYSDCIATDISVLQNDARYLWRYAATAEQREEVIKHMVRRLAKNVLLRTMRSPLPTFIRPYFSLLASHENSLLFSTVSDAVVHDLDSFQSLSQSRTVSERKMSIVVEYVETLTDCWVATNDTLLSLSSTKDTVHQEGDQRRHASEVASATDVDARKMLLKSVIPAMLTHLLGQFIFLEEILETCDISPPVSGLKDGTSSRLYLVVRKDQILSSDPIVRMQIVKICTEYFANLEVVIDCRGNDAVVELEDLWLSFQNNVKHVSILGRNVRSIGDNFLPICTALTTIKIPNSVTSIGDRFLYGCRGLTAVDIPSSIITIGDNFLAFTGITTVTIPASVTSIGDSFLAGCMCLKNVSIPDSITSISNDFLLGCTGITTITIPNSVTRIGNGFLYECTGLIRVAIPDTVTMIGDFFLFNCRSVTTVNIPNRLARIPNGFLCHCSRLTTTISIPDSVTSIGYDFLYHCTGITTVTIPQSVNSIGNNLFHGCTGLTVVSIPKRFRCKYRPIKR